MTEKEREREIDGQMDGSYRIEGDGENGDERGNDHGADRCRTENNDGDDWKRKRVLDIPCLCLSVCLYMSVSV